MVLNTEPESPFKALWPCLACKRIRQEIEFTVQYGLNKFKSQSLGVGSFKDPTDINELGESIN
jgi:hypothetical protein